MLYFYDLFAWVDCWSSVSIRRIIYKILNVHMSQCMTKGGLWHDVILMRKEHYDVIAVYFSICTKSKSFEQRKINVIEE